jgi:hypothetical protein
MKLELKHNANTLSESFGFSEQLTDKVEEMLFKEKKIGGSKSEVIERVFNSFKDEIDNYILPDNPKTENSITSYHIYLGMCIARAILFAESNAMAKALKEDLLADLKSKISGTLIDAIEFDKEKFKQHLESEEDDF